MRIGFQRGRRVAAATSLAALCAWSADANSQADPCVLPGSQILSDAEGDWSGGRTSGIGTTEQDLVGAWIAQSTAPDGAMLMHFRIKVAGPPDLELLPNSAWYVSFESLDGDIHGVRLQTDAMGTPQYFSYSSAGGSTDAVDGRFVRDGSEKPALAASGPDGEGNIDITIPALDVAVLPEDLGRFLLGFNAASILYAAQPARSPMQVAAVTIDQVPDDLVREGDYQVQACGAQKIGSGLLTGGSPGLFLLTGLMLAALRRTFGRAIF